MTSDENAFDYIVTGAGSAGCVIAAPLSESGRYRVLLLEAGDRDRHPWIQVPMGYGRLFSNPRVNWMYESEPEAQLGGRRLKVNEARPKTSSGGRDMGGGPRRRSEPRW